MGLAAALCCSAADRCAASSSGTPSSSSSAGASSSCLGFDSLGSRPSFIARRMRAAFHFANLIFFCVSSSGGPQTDVSWKKAAAASNVSAVCLGDHDVRHCLGGRGCLVLMRDGRDGREGGVPRHLVGAQHLLAAVKRLLGKLLDVGLPRRIVDYGVVVRVLRFHLVPLSASSRTWSSGLGPPRTFSSLSIRSVVYARHSSSALCSCFERIWLTA